MDLDGADGTTMTARGSGRPPLERRRGPARGDGPPRPRVPTVEELTALGLPTAELPVIEDTSTAPAPPAPPLPQRDFTVPAAVPGRRPAAPLDGPRHLAPPKGPRPRGGRQPSLAHQVGRALSSPGPLARLAPLAMSLLLAVISLAQIDRTDPGGALGLAAVLPATWWLAAAVLSASFAWLVVTLPPTGPRAGSLLRGRGVSWVLAAHLAVLVILLHGTPGLIDAHGRFPTAWTHVGFIDHIVETGGVDPNYDARYNWPGAFSLGAFLTELTGSDSARELVRFAPVVVNMLFLAPLALVLRHATRDVRLRWIALWLFVVTNWVGQDYLAPQAVALLGYLAVVAVLLRWFRRSDLTMVSPADLLARLRRRFPRLASDDRLVHATTPPPPARAGQEFGLLLVLAGIGIVLAFSHQLTPFMLVIAALLLVTTGRVTRPLVPVLLAACAVAWTGLGTTSFLRSNLEDLTSSLGDIGGVVDESQGRVGPELTRQIVLGIRLVLMGAAGVLGAFGLWRQWRERRADWGLACLAIAPLSLAALNSYGGEILLRISLFSLPFTAVLGAFAFLREGRSRRSAWPAGVAFFLATALLIPAFVVARYGNEAFERIYDDDIAAWDFVVDNAHPGARVVVPDFAGPWRYRSLMRLDYRLFADEIGGPMDPVALDALVDEGDGPGYLILGTASAQHRHIAAGYPADWQDDLARELLETERYHVVFESGETLVLERYDESRIDPVAPERTASGPGAWFAIDPNDKGKSVTP